MNDVETRLRSADPLQGEDSPEHRERDDEWLRRRIVSILGTPGTVESRAQRRQRTLVAVAAAAAVLAGVGGATLADVSDSADRQPTTEAPMELALAPDSPTMASCIPFSNETLAGMPVAFSGTVIDEDAERVLIQVDHWYRGGDTDQVSLFAPDISMTSLEGMLDFEKGQRYLVTAGSGVVNYCGFTARWTGPMATTYQQAFDGN